ncbi:MAG: protease modulator HflC [Acetobacteraceae bacterium]|nr:protease modulator HflC [Acetobacteraceae bacterium]
MGRRNEGGIATAAGKAWSFRRHGVGALVLVALGAVVAQCVFVVGTTESALVTDFGNPVRAISTPGLHFKFPYQTVRRFDTRTFVTTPPASEFLTLEKTPVVASGTILWRIADAKRFFETVFDRTGAESRLGDIMFAQLGAAIGRSPLTAFVSSEPGQDEADTILAGVTAQCRSIARQDYGIDVGQILLRGFDFPVQNRPRLFARMASERGRLSMQYRSEGEEEGLKLRAQAEQEKTHILAEAFKLAQQYRGEGEAEAARISAETFSQAPDLYRFLRSLQAAPSLIHQGTTLVLSADSELFGLFFDSGHYAKHLSSGEDAMKPDEEGGTKPQQGKETVGK